MPMHQHAKSPIQGMEKNPNHVHDIMFVETCTPAVKRFFSSRTMECLHSNLDMENIKNAGLAILDTGTSRSGI